MFTGTEEKSERWLRYFYHLRDVVEYTAWMFEEMGEIYVPRVVLLLSKLGVDIPALPPTAAILSSDEYEYTEFDNLVHSYLECHGMLVSWIQAKVNPLDTYAESSEIFELCTAIEESSFDIVVRWIKEDLLICGTDETEINSFNFKVTQETKSTVLDLYRELVKHNLPFSTDYFNLLNTHPEVLIDDVELDLVFANSIEDVLPYGEKQILAETRRCNELLEELHIKMDTLLSDGSKKLLSDKLEHTKPLFNKVLEQL